MRELVRLFYLVIVTLPLVLLFIGPLLVLAALRGRQRVGPIVFDPGRRGIGSRALALLLGLLLWLVVWGGLVMLLRQGGLPRAAGVSPSTPAGYLEDAASVTSTLPAQGPPEVATPTSAPTMVPSPTPQPTATATLTSAQGEDTPTPSPSPSPTSPPVPPTAAPTPIPPTATPTPTVRLTPAATLSPDQAAHAIAAVETANELLRAAVTQPSIGNLAALEVLWQAESLAKAQAFAQDLYQRFLRPLEVSFVYLIPPVALEGTTSDTAIVMSTEAWTYAGPRASYSESFEFIYTLTRQDAGWVITNYTYRNIPNSLSPVGQDVLPTVPASVTITATIAITATGQ